MKRLPDEVLNHVFLFMTFKDLDALGFPLGVVMQRLGVRPPKHTRWVFYRNRYVPFQYHGSEITRSIIYMRGRVYPSFTSEGWVDYRRNFYSPWAFQTIMRDKTTSDMVPWVLEGDPRLEITYRGKRRRQRFTFQQGQEVDVMDARGEWWKGVMVACKGHLIQYHFHGWESKWDVWYPNDSLHVAPLYSVTREWRSSLRVGHRVDVKAQEGGWYEGRISRRTRTVVGVRLTQDPRAEEMEIKGTSERLQFHGAHTWASRSPFRVSNVVWKDGEGQEVYQYRVRGGGGNTVLVDHILSDSEIKTLLG